MSTVQQVIDRARVPLNDGDKVRYSDPELLDYLRDGVAEAYGLRPDLRFGTYGTRVELLELTDTFPLSAQHEVAIKHYLVFRAESKDDEHVVAAREGAAFKLFERGILGT